MAFFQGLESDLLSTMTQTAQTISTSLVTAIVPVFVTAATVMIFFHGLAALRGDAQQPFMTLFWRIVKIGIIILVLENYISYDVIGVGQSIMHGLSSAIANSSDPIAMVDNATLPLIGFFAGMIVFGMSMLNDGSMGNIAIGLMVFFFVIMGGAVYALAVFYTLLSLLGLTLVLGLGPLFIAGLAFGPTAKFFDGWISSILGLSLIGPVAAVFINIISSAETNALATSFPNIFAGLFDVIMMSLVFLLFMMEIPRLVSTLTQAAEVTGGLVGFAQIRGVYGAPWFTSRAAGAAAAASAGASAGASLAQRAAVASRVAGR
jgi:type IV secretion system protein VirB6